MWAAGAPCGGGKQVGGGGGGRQLGLFPEGDPSPRHPASLEMRHGRPGPQTHSQANHLGLKECLP